MQQTGFYSNKIRSLGYAAAQDYLVKGKDLNATVSELCRGENQEMTKRVCELANQQVYLTLFNRPGSNRANIKFSPATMDGVNVELKSQEKAMSDYSNTPKDYRQKTASDIIFKSEATPASNEKIGIIQKIASTENKLNLLRSSMLTMKIACERDSMSKISTMHRHARTMVVQGESLGDVAKIACRSVMEQGLDHIKVATVMDYIGTEIAKEGLKVSNEFTKISSMPVSHKNPMNVLAREYVESVEKTAGFADVIAGIDAHIAHVCAVMEKAEAL